NLIKLKFNRGILSSPFCSSLLYFVVFLIGIYFSILSSPINEWITSDEIMTNGVSVSFSITVSLLAITIIVFVLNQISIVDVKKEDDKEKQKSYQSKIDQLHDIIQLAPPNGFAEILSNYVDIADDFVQYIQDKKKDTTDECAYIITELNIKQDHLYKGFETYKKYININDVKTKEHEIRKHIETLNNQIELYSSYIRAILIAYTRLAALFDNTTPSDTKENTYRANLMLKYNITDTKDIDISKFRYLPSIIKNDKKINITHYLTLNEEHSVKVYSGKFKITKKDSTGNFIPVTFSKDKDIKSFSLPIFLGEDKANYNCFGAPRAVSNVECQFINDTKKEIEIWENKKTSPIEIINEAKEYFNRRDIAKSIISIPLMHSRYDVEHKTAKHVLGVVNIYRDKTNLMMGDIKKQKQFEYITTPLNYALAKIIAHDVLHRYHASALQDILCFANISEDIVNNDLTGE
ncbi:hypothetical protein QMU85_003926, partial [Photobacterium damselae]|nr:hypothetical protein [Photobacterium damselae]